MFFWQCRASSVTRWRARPSPASRACTAGISLDSSAMSMCASTSAVSVASALSTWAAAQSLNWSKLPRSVFRPGRCWCAVLERVQLATAPHDGEGVFDRLGIEPLENIADGGMRGSPSPGQAEEGVKAASVDVDECDDATI
jgi:hypothetical protein